MDSWDVEACWLAIHQQFSHVSCFISYVFLPLKPYAKPYALYTARQVLLSMRKEVQKELNLMESLEVIS